MSALLQAEGVVAGYKGHPFVQDLDLEVREREVVALLGHNGAGKTTTLLALSGDMAPLGGVVRLFGRPVKTPLHRRARRGLAFVTEERSVFMQMTVAENLRVGGADARAACELFPELQPLLNRQVGKLSGGEQQMLTLGRALGRPTRLLLIDELSLGLAPLVVERLMQAVRAAADERGLGVLLVEQHVEDALRFSDRAYVMRRGKVVLEGASSEIAGRVRELEDAYLAQGSSSDGSEPAP